MRFWSILVGIIFAAIHTTEGIAAQLPKRGMQTQLQPETEKTPDSAASANSKLAATDKQSHKSFYFQISGNGAFGHYRYLKERTSSEPFYEGDTLIYDDDSSEKTIGRYKGPGCELGMELGSHWRNGFSLAAFYHMSVFPALDRYWLNRASHSYDAMSKTESIYVFVTGLDFLFFPFGDETPIYFGLKTGLGFMKGVPLYIPVPFPALGAVLGYDFITAGDMYLGVQLTWMLAGVIGGESGDLTDTAMKARLWSVGLGLTLSRR